MAKFDLHTLLSERSKEAAGQREETGTEEMEQISVNIYDLASSDENFYSAKEYEDLKQSISLVGLLQPLLVKQKNGYYEIQAGHRRRMACLDLLKEGREEFQYIPCVIQKRQEQEEGQKVDKILDRLSLIFANQFREKTEWEKMEEALRTEELIADLRKEVSMEGRTRKLLAEFTGTSEAQIAKYKAIKNNLCEMLMEEFRAGKVNVSTAYELSGLSKEYQEMACEIYMEFGMVSIQEAKDQEEPEEEQSRIEEEQKAEKGEQEVAAEEQETRETEREVIYVDTEPKEIHGCFFCDPESKRKIATAAGGFVLDYDAEKKKVNIIHVETGEIESIHFQRCPYCGRKLQ